MIRVHLNNGRVEDYESIEKAQFMLTLELLASNGAVIPESAVEVMGKMPGGTVVERVLNIKLAVVELT